MIPFYNKRDLSFQLFELVPTDQLTRFPYFEAHDRASFDLILDAADRIATTQLRPLLTEMDRQEPQLVDGRIRVHPGMRAIINRFGDDGWINAPFGFDEGGQQLPLTIHNAAAFIMQAANYSASVFPFLTTGAANLIRTFGSPDLIGTFTPLMYAGRWQGTMALTEPDAGSSLSDLNTRAKIAENGDYRISGQKIYISAGDHDACENVVHLMLARIEGAPAGTKGISLFVVPRERPDGMGGLTANDVQTAGVYHKMGYKGAPIAHLMVGSQDNCRGWLVGEPGRGLHYMFQMMNEARVGVGMNATAIGTAAYQVSLAYARQRPQGRPMGSKNLANPQVPIIRHADVKRMLLFQKAVLEGSLSLLMQCGYWSDLARVAGGDERDRAVLLLDLLTPVAKSYPSEMACLTTSAAVQILGGAGYTTDFPVEQYYREARIHPIHEGTTGIHGLDLLGRKVTQHGGRAVRLLLAEMQTTVAEAHNLPETSPLADQLAGAIAVFEQVTAHLLPQLPTDPERALADATLYLELTGIVVIGWQWLRQATVAQRALPAAHAGDQDFYRGKLAAATYFMEYELVKIHALAPRLLSDDAVTVTMQDRWF